jgi:hypothetical protein
MEAVDTEQLIERIVARLEERIAMRFGAAMPYNPTFTTDQAVEYTAHNSRQAFYDWIKLRGGNSCGHGKWLKSELDRLRGLDAALVRSRRAKLRRKRGSSKTAQITSQAA